MKETQIQQSQNLPDSIFLSFLISAIHTAIEPLLMKLLDDSNKSRIVQEMGEEPIDVEEAARIIKKSKNTVYSYCSKGTIIFHKSGNKTLFYRSELLEWLKTK